MAIVNFVFSLSGAVFLLLFGVRMVRTGIERTFGASFQRFMTGQTSLLRATALGIGLAVLMQSSAAVALLTAGFAASGAVEFATAVAIVMGGDLGSALLIRVLSFDLNWLVPVLLTVGGYLFVKTEGKRARQAGRIIMGLAFILISLQFLRGTMEPIRDSDLLPSISGYLAKDYVTAFIVGALLAFVMHSSVAAVLMFVALVQIDVLPFSVGLSLILGANLGSAIIPVWLTKEMNAKARRVSLANLTLRGSGAVLALWPTQALFTVYWVPESPPALMLIMFHILFNAMLVLISLPIAVPLGKLLTVSDSEGDVSSTENEMAMRTPSALANKIASSPAVALADLKKELLHMSEVVDLMFRSVPTLYQEPDKELIRQIRERKRDVNQSLALIRDYVAAIPVDQFTKQEAKAARSMMEYALRLERAGDICAFQISRLAGEIRDRTLTFSKQGWIELVDMHQAILANLGLASNVLISDDLESARLLSLEKTEIKRVEYRSRKRHLKRLQSGNIDSYDSSDVHLETIRAFREFNGHIAAVAYPVLYRHGQLLETRLVAEVGLGTQPD
jgi:phosphate:Na+ symporter